MRRGTPKFRLIESSAGVQEIQSRMPWSPGSIARATVPLLVVRLEIEGKDKKRAVGFASECLLREGTVGDQARSCQEQVADKITAYRAARQVYLNAGAKPLAAVEIWEAAHGNLVAECERRGINALTACLGGSLLERAMVDALCRLRQVSFFEALRTELLGFDTARHLPAAPLAAIRCRHTVELNDPITRGEIREEDRVDDGLPQALEDEIDTYALSHFKVKLGGDHDRDLGRLSRIAVLIHQRCREGYTIALDGNERHSDPNALERLVEALRARPYGTEFLDATLYIEQPIPREKALLPEMAATVSRLAALKPISLDESDDQLDAFARATELGYLGVSLRGSKGLFKSLRNHVWIQTANRDRMKRKLPLFFQTGEDHGAVPALALQQDLAVLAALGIDPAGRTSHHQFRGLDHLPPAEASSAAREHTDLYEERADGIFLRIQGGSISLRSLQTPGFGHGIAIALEARTALDQYMERVEASANHD